MKLKEEYARESDKEADKTNKKVISDDTYALCEFLELLNDNIALLRLKK
jgi:hypothetical protein